MGVDVLLASTTALTDAGGLGAATTGVGAPHAHTLVASTISARVTREFDCWRSIAALAP